MQRCSQLYTRPLSRYRLRDVAQVPPGRGEDDEHVGCAPVLGSAAADLHAGRGGASEPIESGSEMKLQLHCMADAQSVSRVPCYCATGGEPI